LTFRSDLAKGTFVCVSSAIFYSGAVVFVRYAYRAGVSPGTAIFLRFVLASAALGLFLRLTGRWVKLPPARIAALFGLGFLAYTVLGVTWFWALNTTPAWLVSLLLALYPLLVNVGSWLFLREPVRRLQVAALFSVLVGGVVLFWQPFEGATWTGVALMLVNVVINALYVLVGQRWTQGVPPAMSAAWMIIGAAVGTCLYAVFFAQLSFSFDLVGWVWIALFAVISTVLSIMFLWWGIGLIGPSRASIIGSLEPLFSILLSVFILGERLSLLQLPGGVFILTGMFLVQWQPNRLRA